MSKFKLSLLLISLLFITGTLVGWEINKAGKVEKIDKKISDFRKTAESFYNSDKEMLLENIAEKDIQKVNEEIETELEIKNLNSIQKKELTNIERLLIRSKQMIYAREIVKSLIDTNGVVVLDANIADVEKTINNLSLTEKKYADFLNVTLNNAKSQLETIDKAKGKVASMFTDDSKSTVKSDVTREIITETLSIINTIKHDGIKKELFSNVEIVNAYLDNREKQEKIQKEQALVKKQVLATTQHTTIGIEAVILDIPIISQLPELPTGCEITAVTMMLRYHGNNVDKVTLAKEMPYHETDPNLGFVGSPFKTSGRTINPSALLAIVTKYAGSAVDLTGSDTSVLEKYIQSNKPVVLWMKMHTFNVHAITLSGYDDKNFYFNDPWTGEKNAALDRVTFINKWNAQNRKALSF